MSSESLDNLSDVVACVYHLREASICIESRMPDLSLAILETAKAVADVSGETSIEDSVKEFREVIDDIREAK